MSSHILLALLACVAIAAAGNPLLYKQFPIDGIQEIQPRQNDAVNYRLPNNTIPESYNVQFTTLVHQGDRLFSGSVDITIDVVSQTSSIVLHHRQLTIGTITLTNTNGGGNILLAPEPYPYDPITEFLTINLAAAQAPLPVGGKYILRIPFSGQLRTDEAGFYLSSYLAADNTIRSLATTQFESTDARHGFPCYDEPAFRATFTIAITHDATYTAISNMPATRTPQPNNMITTTFETTPPTPTYLLAYVVSDFDYRGNTGTPTAFQQKVYARPNAISGADFGLQAGIDILTAFENYFGNKFPLPKMDQVAVPDFAAGAMENWGLVTYREQYILFFESTSTFVDKYNIATIIAHEYAHQWFGNLITPKWWTYIWLNEGFATLFEFYATHWVFPEWNILDTFVLTSQNVMQSDASPNTRPMTHYVESPQAVSQLFDNVAYPKSGSVLRMFMHAFSEASFKKGLINYQNKMAYSSATEEDLIEGIETAVREDYTLPVAFNLTNIVLSWTRQAGFPVVNVNRDYTSGVITLQQERYFTVKPNVQSPSLWWIPYNFASASSSVYSTFAERWIQGQRSTVVSDPGIIVTSGDWLIINNEQTGFYRVQYDNQNYKLIANELTTGDLNKFKITTRSSIISDVFDFANTERLNYTVVFDIIKYLEHEVEYVPWSSAFTGLNNVDRLFAGSSKYADLSKFIVKLLTHLYSTTGVLDVAVEPHFKKQSRITAMNWACRLGLESCLLDANTLLKENIASGRVIHQNNLLAVYCNGIRSASQEDYTKFWEKLSGQTNSAERLRIISALTCKRDSATLSNLLQTSISTTASALAYASSTERVRVFNDVAANGQIGATEAIKFLIINLDNANAQYTTNSLNNALSNLARFVVSDELRVEYNLLLTAAAEKTYITANAIAAANNNLAANKRWTDRNQVDIENWLAENGASSFTVPSMIIAVLLVVSRLF